MNAAYRRRGKVTTTFNFELQRDYNWKHVWVGQSGERDDEIIINDSRDVRISNKENAELCYLKIETLKY